MTKGEILADELRTHLKSIFANATPNTVKHATLGGWVVLNKGALLEALASDERRRAAEAALAEFDPGRTSMYWANYLPVTPIISVADERRRKADELEEQARTLRKWADEC